MKKITDDDKLARRLLEDNPRATERSKAEKEFCERFKPAIWKIVRGGRRGNRIGRNATTDEEDDYWIIWGGLSENNWGRIRKWKGLSADQKERGEAGSLEAYVCTCARNLATDIARRVAKKAQPRPEGMPAIAAAIALNDQPNAQPDRLHEDNDNDEAEEQAEYGFRPRLRTEEPPELVGLERPEVILERKEIVQGFWASLTPTQKKIFELTHIDKKSDLAIAQELKMKLATVQVHRSRGEDAVMNWYSNYNGGQP